MAKEKIPGTHIYGHSDDTIICQGEVHKVFDCYSNPIRHFKASDGTKGKIEYTEDGQWHIEVEKAGPLCSDVTFPLKDESAEHESATADFYHIASYSAFLSFLPGITGIRFWEPE